MEYWNKRISDGKERMRINFKKNGNLIKMAFSV